MGNELIKDTINTTIFNTIGKGVGFLIPFFIAAWFGISAETDAFFFAYGLIIFLATIFAPVLESIIVPFIAEMRQKGEDVGEFVGRVLGISGIGLFVLSSIFVVVIKPILSLTTRFSPEGLRLIYLILLESIPLVILLVWTSILSGVLNAYKVFSIPALSPGFKAVVTLGFIFAFKDILNVHSIALGYVVGEIFRLGILLAVCKKLNLFHLKLSIRWENRFFDFFKTSSYQVAGMTILAFTTIINKTMASWLGEGNVTILEYADRLYMIPYTFISSGLMITLLSYWSKRYYSEGGERLNKDIKKAIKKIGGICLFITLVFFIMKDYLVSAVYGYGKFPSGYLKEVSTTFGFFIIGLTPIFLGQIYSRAFIIMKETRVLLITALLMTVGTVLFNLALMPIMGVSGIAIANSGVGILSFGILSFIYHWRQK